MDETKTLLIDVQARATEALKEIGATKLEVDRLKKAQKELDTTTKEGKESYTKMGIEIKSYNAVIRESEKDILNNLKAQRQQEGSLKSLEALLSITTEQRKKLSDEDLKGAKGQGLTKTISEITTRLKAEEEAVQNHRRSVGDYAKGAQSLRAELRAGTEEIARMIREGTNSGPMFDKMVQDTAELRDAMGDATGAINAMASDTSKIDALGQGIQGATAAFGLYSSVMGLVTDDQEQYEKITKNLQITMAALMSITTLMNLAQKESALYITLSTIAQKAGIVQTVRATVAKRAYVTMLRAETVGAKAAALAQWLWNLALSANPVVAVLVAVTALIGGYSLLSGALDSSAKATKRAEKANAEYERQATRTAQAIAEIDQKLDESTKQREVNAKNDLAILIRSGASKEAIAKREKQLRDENLADELSAIDERKRTQQILTDSALVNYLAQEEVAIKVRKSKGLNSKAHNEELAKLFDLDAKYKEHVGTLNLVELAYNDLLATRAVDNAKEVQSNKETAKQNAKAAEDRLTKSVDLESKIAEAKLKAEKKYQNDSTKSVFENSVQRALFEAEFETRSAKLKNDSEIKKLEIQRRYGSISKTEFDKQLQIIQLGQTELENQQAEALKQIYTDRKNEIIGLLQKETETQIAELQKQYAEASADISRDETLSAEQQSYYRTQLSIQESKQIREIRKASTDGLIQDIESKWADAYASDLILYSDNEREKARTEIAILEKTIADKKAIGVSTLADELAINARKISLNKIALDTELLNERNTLKQRYDLKKKALESELALQVGNADAVANLTAQMKVLDAEYTTSKIEQVEMWAGKSMEVISALNGLANAIGQAEVQKAEEENATKQAALDKRLKSGQLSQRQYDKANIKLAEDLDKKKAKIARDQAIRERAQGIASVAINTSVAILKILAQSGIFAAPLIAAASVLGAIQLATILATPLPKAAKGGSIVGAKHSGGGVLIEAEGGESIINAKASAAYPEMISLMNAVGITGRVPDGGYATRALANESLQTATNKAILSGSGSGGSIDYEVLTDMVATKLGDKISQIKVYTSLEEFRRDEGIYTEIEQARSI